MWVFLRLVIYITLVLGIIQANGSDESDVIENIKKLNGFAILTHSVHYEEITEDYTEFERKLSKREEILETEPGKLHPIYDPNNVNFQRDFDRGKFL